MNPLYADGRPWRDVSLGDSIEDILKPKRGPTRREKLNLPDDVITPPSSPSTPSPPRPPPRRLRAAQRKSKQKQTNMID